MKLVLTGGPSGGKTTLANLIQKQFGDRVVIVPEAASILFRGGFPRRFGDGGVRARQKAIFYVQRELENSMQDEFSDSLLVCDRGSLDGVAYWPGSEPDFLSALGTSLDEELSRYQFVLHLDTAAEAHYDLTNPLRTETFPQAWALNERIKAAWSPHPNRFVIENVASGRFIEKLGRAISVIQDILDGPMKSPIPEQTK